jgi:ornithine cyclodeaminase/alanine dehydrogenase
MNDMSEETLLLTRSDVAALLTIEDYINAVEQAFRLYGEGKTEAPGILGVHAHDGGFHIKVGVLDLERSFFAAKVNANFPNNAKRFGLPLIQGVIVLANAENGSPLAVMDSMEITVQRTGAATAVAAKYLARADSKTLTICGCGNQGEVSLRALSRIFAFENAFVYDIEAAQAKRLARKLSDEFGFHIEAVDELGRAVRRSDVVATCTPSTRYYLYHEYVRPGTFVAAVGADSETKQELDPTLLVQNKTVVDILEQCASIGELHHALDSELMTKQQIHAELGQVIAGTKPGRTSSKEIIVFDSTGMALQDVIAAATAYEQAIVREVGTRIRFAQ